MVKLYGIVRALLSGKRIYKVQSLGRVVLASSHEQCTRKFPKHTITKATVGESIGFILLNV